MTLPGLPPEGQDYATIFEAAATSYNVEPYLIAAVCSRESEFGHSDYLDVKGPGGTGDHTSRDPHRIKNPATPIEILPGGRVMPADGRGWGRGLMQLDWAAHPELWVGDDWKDAFKNIMSGARELKRNLLAFKFDLFLAVSAYNMGAPRVEAVLKKFRGSTLSERNHVIDFHSANHNYGTDVLRRRYEMLKRANKSQPAVA